MNTQRFEFTVLTRPALGVLKEHIGHGNNVIAIYTSKKGVAGSRELSRIMRDCRRTLIQSRWDARREARARRDFIPLGKAVGWLTSNRYKPDAIEAASKIDLPPTHLHAFGRTGVGMTSSCMRPLANGWIDNSWRKFLVRWGRS